jgi:hypothetical protein
MALNIESNLIHKLKEAKKVSKTIRFELCTGEGVVSFSVFQTTATHSILIHPLTLTPQQRMYTTSSVAPSVEFTSHHSLEYGERMLNPAIDRFLRASASSAASNCKKAVSIIGQLWGASIAHGIETILVSRAFSVLCMAKGP